MRRLDEGIVRAAQHDHVHLRLAQGPGELGDVRLQRLAFEVTLLDEVDEAGARLRDDLDAVRVGADQAREPLGAQGARGGHHADPAAPGAGGRRLHRRLEADHGHAEGLAQRLQGRAAGGVAGDDHHLGRGGLEVAAHGDGPRRAPPRGRGRRTGNTRCRPRRRGPRTGSARRISRATLSPPTPESKMPTGVIDPLWRHGGLDPPRRPVASSSRRWPIAQPRAAIPRMA